MHAPVPKGDGPTPPVEQKHRTITLTNRAPVSIIEGEWKTVSEGKYYEEGPTGPEDSVSVEIRVRRHQPRTPEINGRPYPALAHDLGYIIHGKYELYMEDRPDRCQMVRVGRVLTPHEAALDLWKHIQAVGDELRERIKSDHCRKHVIHAVDQCFASLPTQSVW